MNFFQGYEHAAAAQHLASLNIKQGWSEEIPEVAKQEI